MPEVSLVCVASLLTTLNEASNRSTVFTTRTITTTASAKTTIITAVQTTFPTITDVISQTSIVSIEDTVTVTASSAFTDTILETESVTVTGIVRETDTVTETLLNTVTVVGKRDAVITSSGDRPSLHGPTDVGKRGVDPYPMTGSPTKIPSTASGVCVNTLSYSSACSCHGIQGQTTTTRPTITSTITSTKTVTPHVSVTATNVVTDPVTLSETAVVTLTEQTTDATVTAIIPVVTDVTATVDVSVTTLLTATVAVTQTAALTQTVTAVCSSFIAQATSGSYSGQYLNFDAEDTPLLFVSSVSQATTFVNLNGEIAPASDTGAIFNSFDDSIDFVYASSNPAASGYPILTCSFGDSTSPPAGALACTSSNGNSDFLTCPSASESVGVAGSSLIISNGATDGADCAFLGLIAIAAC